MEIGKLRRRRLQGFHIQKYVLKTVKTKLKKQNAIKCIKWGEM